MLSMETSPGNFKSSNFELFSYLKLTSTNLKSTSCKGCRRAIWQLVWLELDHTEYQ